MLESNDNLHTADGLQTEFSKNQLAEQHPLDGELSADNQLSEPTIVAAPEENAETTAHILIQNSTPDNDNVVADEPIDTPLLDYDSLSMDDLVNALEAMVGVENVIAIKDQIEHIKSSYLSKYNHFLEDKKDLFAAENPDSNETFSYNLPSKAKFDQLYSLFRDKRNKHFKTVENNQKSNLETRIAIVEELKNLIDPQSNIKNALKQFNELRDRWKNAGPIPKDKYNHVWNNYHFHVENFYDLLHQDREARDLEFKNNLDQKQKIVARAAELAEEQDVNKAFYELQDLHRIWKEEIGPVGKEHREEIWNQFSVYTKIMHDKRDVIFEELRASEVVNLEKKQAVIAQIVAITAEKMEAHSNWQPKVEQIEALRTEFFAIGKVPKEENEATWSAFKNAVREFNTTKNSFYKDIKKEQLDNLRQKEALVEKAKSLQDSVDYATTTPILKQIQEDWKKIGHVPRKNSDAIWTEFRAACNQYFDNLKANRNQEDAEEIACFDKKKEYLDTIMTLFEMTGDHKSDLDAIKTHIAIWKTLGKVPQNRRHIDGKFNKMLDGLFEKLSLSKKDSEMMRFSNRIENLSEANDTRKLDSEKVFLSRKIDEIQHEVNQLENNIQFFTNTKNAKKENSIVTEVRKNITIKKEEIDVLKSKLKQLKNLIVQ
ncbi:MAG: hypothetical protein RLZZ312_918 [Bacteroidota bacterium]